MAEVHDLADHRREFITNAERSELRATWHEEAGFVVISLWRGNTCVATSHLTPKEAGRLATFITGGLADLASARVDATAASTRKIKRSTRLGDATKNRQERVARFLERLAQRLR